MPIALTTPIQPTPQPNIAIVSVNITVEPNVVVQVTYAATDVSGNLIPQTFSSVTLGAPALAAFAATGGGFKAKIYAALQTQVPALAGTVS